MQSNLTAQFATLRLTLAELRETEYPYDFLTNVIPYYAENAGFGANGETRLHNALNDDTLFYDNDCNEYRVTIPVVSLEIYADRNETQLVNTVRIPTARLRDFVNEDDRITGEDILALLDQHYGGAQGAGRIILNQLSRQAA